MLSRIETLEGKKEASFVGILSQLLFDLDFSSWPESLAPSAVWLNAHASCHRTAPTAV